MKPTSSAFLPRPQTDDDSARAHRQPIVPRLTDAASFIGRLSAQDEKRRILLLQGPVGPFFGELQDQLVRDGFAVDRVAFSPADRLFAGGGAVTRFSGDLAAWRDWLQQRIATNPPEAIILFGSNRPAHACARALAAENRISVISLEEGYLRSGYITCETGGNNQHSPLALWSFRRSVRIALPAAQTPPPGTRGGFLAMSLWGAVHYLVRDTLSQASDRALFHRDRAGLLPLCRLWGRHVVNRLAARWIERPTLRRLRGADGYILVPLQVPADSQLAVAARGWTSAALIETCLQTLTTAGPTQRLVFKLHPLDPLGGQVRRAILRRTAALGLDTSRVIVLQTGRIGELARHASGMIVINSTSAFSALHHNVPVLVLGQAVYRHDSIVTTGSTPADVAAFLHDRAAKPRAFVDGFLADLKAEALLPGDFYLRRGRKTAIAGIIARLNQGATDQRAVRR